MIRGLVSVIRSAASEGRRYLSVELVQASRASIAWRLEHFDAGRSAAQLDQEFKSMARHALRQAPVNGRFVPTPAAAKRGTAQVLIPDPNPPV